MMYVKPSTITSCIISFPLGTYDMEAGNSVWFLLCGNPTTFYGRAGVFVYSHTYYWCSLSSSMTVTLDSVWIFISIAYPRHTYMNTYMIPGGRFASLQLQLPCGKGREKRGSLVRCLENKAAKEKRPFIRSVPPLRFLPYVKVSRHLAFDSVGFSLLEPLITASVSGGVSHNFTVRDKNLSWTVNSWPKACRKTDTQNNLPV